LEVARSIINALEDKKGEDILLLDIQEISSFADYFVICNGTSDRMLDALADTAAEAAKKNHKINGRIEGGSKSGWVVVDLGDVVVHLFSKEQRDYYRLEELWSQGKILVHLH
jgi:ribosome-associated protein